MTSFLAIPPGLSLFLTAEDYPKRGTISDESNVCKVGGDEKKRRELAALEAELAERELELATLQAELNAFEREYLREERLKAILEE